MSLSRDISVVSREAVWKPYLFPALIGLMLFLACSIAFMRSFSDKHIYCSGDLRARIIGGRLLVAGENPYRYVWREGEPEKFLDPRRRTPGPARATYTPVALWLYAPFSSLDYRSLTFFWFFAEWGALIAVLGTLAAFLPRQKILLFSVVAAHCFILTHFWRLHLERGQYYVFVTLLLSLLLFSARKGRSPALWLLLGLLIAFRPNFILVLPLLFLLKEARLAILAGTTALTLALAASGGKTALWFDFLANSKLVGLLVLKRFDYSPYGPAVPLPKFAEGVNFTSMMDAKTYNCSMQSLLLNLGVPVDQVPGVNLALMAGAFSLICLLAWKLRRNDSLFFRVGFSLTSVVLLEYFLPVRFGYADMVFLPLLALALSLKTRAAEFAVIALVPICLWCEYLAVDSTGTVVRSMAFAVAAAIPFVTALCCRREEALL